MVGLSLFFSYLIWFAPTQVRTDDVATLTKTSKTLSDRQVEKIFTPTVVVYTKDGASQICYHDDLARKLHDEIVGSDLKLEKKALSYADVVELKNAVELRYIDDVSSLNYQTIFLDKKIFKDDFSFDDIKVNLDNNEIYFIDNKAKNVRVLTGTAEKISMIKMIDDKATIHYNAKLDEALPGIYFYSDAFELPKYTFLTSTLATRSIANEIFVDDKEFTENVTDNEYTYSVNGDLNDKTLIIDENNGVLNYSFKDETKSLLDVSIDYLSKLTVDVSTLGFFAKGDGTLTFRDYILGIPIFAADGESNIKISKQNHMFNIVTNLVKLNVPVPDNEMIQMPNTDEVLAALQSKGIDPAKIENLTIGYAIEYTAKSATAKLTPSWYYLLDGTWTRLD
jgi:hypothetical protein